MIVKIIDKKTGKEKGIEEIKRCDIIYFVCDKCGISFIRKHRNSQYCIENNRRNCRKKYLKIVDKHFCRDCIKKESNIEKFGKEWFSQTDACKEHNRKVFIEHME